MARTSRGRNSSVTQPTFMGPSPERSDYRVFVAAVGQPTLFRAADANLPELRLGSARRQKRPYVRVEPLVVLSLRIPDFNNGDAIAVYDAIVSDEAVCAHLRLSNGRIDLVVGLRRHPSGVMPLQCRHMKTPLHVRGYPWLGDYQVAISPVLCAGLETHAWAIGC